MAFTDDTVSPWTTQDRNTANWATWTFTTTSDIAANKLVVAVLATDNVTTTDTNSTDHTSMSVGSMTMTKAREFTNGNAAAAAGVTVSLWYGKNTTGSTIASGATVTVNLGGSAPGSGAKACVARRFSMDSTKIIAVASGADLANDGADTGDLQLSGLTNREYLFLHGIAFEGSSATALTPTGSWTGLVGNQTGAGAAATNVGARWQFRILTGTATGANNPTSGGGAVDHAATLVALWEDTAPAAPTVKQLAALGIG